MAINAPSGATSVNALISQLLALQRRPITDLETRRGQLDLKNAIFNDVKTKLTTLKLKANTLAWTGSLSAFANKTATSSDTGVLTTTAGSSATNGSHTLFVSQLAKAHSAASNRYTKIGTDISTATTGLKSFDIDVNGSIHTVTVTINAGETDETVLGNVAQAINDIAGADVTAAVVHPTSTTTRLSLSSDRTGTSNQMIFTDTDGLLGLLGLTNPGAATDTVGGYINADLGGNELDAKFTLDGLNLVRESNSVSDALTGMTFTLLKAQTAGDPNVTLTVSQDLASIKSKVEEFITAYNDAYGYVTEKLKIDPTTRTRGELVGDWGYHDLRLNLRGIVTGIVDSVQAGNPRLLSEIGITVDGATGTLSLSDSAKFDAAANSGISRIEDLFNSASGVAVRIQSLAEGYVGTGGVISGSKTGVTDKIASINRRIEILDQQLARKEVALRKQFASLQQALNAIVQQQTFLNRFLGGTGSLFGG